MGARPVGLGVHVDPRCVATTQPQDFPFVRTHAGKPGTPKSQVHSDGKSTAVARHLHAAWGFPIRLLYPAVGLTSGLLNLAQRRLVLIVQVLVQSKRRGRPPKGRTPWRKVLVSRSGAA